MSTPPDIETNSICPTPTASVLTTYCLLAQPLRPVSASQVIYIHGPEMLVS